MVSPTVSQIKYRFAEGEREEVAKFSITYSDVYSWEYLYKLMHEWLVDEGYAGEDEDFKEILYEKIETARGSEIWVRWRLTKTDVKTFSALYRYDVDIDIHILGQKEVEVVLGGKKYMADKGEIEVSVRADVVQDPDKKVTNHWLGKNFYNLVFNVFLKSKQEHHEGVLGYDMQRFQEAIKTYLNLETYLPEQELGIVKKRAIAE